MMVDLIKKAENEIILIDKYVDIDTLKITLIKYDAIIEDILSKVNS